MTKCTLTTMMYQINKKYQSCGKKYVRFNPKTNIILQYGQSPVQNLTAYHKVGRPFEDVIWMDEKHEKHWDIAYVDQAAPNYGRDLTYMILIKPGSLDKLDIDTDDEKEIHVDNATHSRESIALAPSAKLDELTESSTVIDKQLKRHTHDNERQNVVSDGLLENLVDTATHSTPLVALAPLAKPDEQVERCSPIQVLPIPNPHIDKPILTKEQLRDVLAWAIERSVGEDYPRAITDELAATPVIGVPQTAVEKLTALLGELVYGDNRYIGPSKTGEMNASLETIVTTVPVLSEQDARARAHDIALTVNSNPVHDDILTGAARTAQVLRPYVQTPTDRLTALRNRYSHTAASQLHKDGDVEQNPGPIYKLTGTDSADDAIKIVSDPTDATSYLNDAGVDWRIDEMAYNTAKGTWAMRHGLDNQTDYIQLDDAYMQYNEISFADQIAAQNYFGSAFYSYAINNKEVKATLTLGELGTAITTATNNIDTFTAMQRTQTNSIAGDALINLFQRAPKTDYGCYLPVAKLLAYEMSKGALSGQESLPYVYDHIIRATPAVQTPLPSVLYPCSDGHNWTFLPAGVAIEAYYVTPTTAGRMMTGAVGAPAGWGLDSRDVAWVVCTGNLNAPALAYYTICHLEYPFFGTVDNVQRVFPPAAGAVPPTTAGTSNPFCLYGNVIQGHKYRVMFVTLTEPINDLRLGSILGPVNVQEWTGVGAPPPATDILPALQGFISNDWRATVGSVTPWFSEVLQYMLKFCDKYDWRAAMWLASSLMGFKDYPVFALAATAAASTTIVRNGNNLAPSVDPTITLRDIAAVPAGSRNTYAGLIQELPKWNMTGMPSQNVPVLATPAANASAPRQTRYISCLVQDTVWQTKMAIGMNMFTKDVLADSEIEKLVKVRLKNLFFAHKHLSDIGFQMTHNLFQDIGATKRAVFIVANNVVDRRVQIFTKLYADYSIFLKNYAGWKFMRPQLPYVPAIPGTAGGNLTGFWNRDTWLDSPVYLFDHSVYKNEPKLYYGFTPEVNYTLIDNAKLALEPGQSNVVQYFGVNQGGNGCVRARWHESVTSATATSTRWKSEYKVAYARGRTVSLLNPGNIITLGSIFLITEHGMNPFFLSVPLANSLGWLRWTSNTAPSDTFRTGGRPFLVWTLPTFPPEQDIVTGQHFALAGATQADFISIRLSYNMLGRGSSNFGMVQLLSAIDGDLQVTDNPF